MSATHAEGETEVRVIEAAAPPARYARGWHCLGLIEHFNDGEPHAVEAFGTKLVVFADSNGRLNILDAYCRHMGGDLTQGRVKGDAVACPFHDWRWGGDGRCAGIPYARRVPLRARTKSWPVLERNGQLYVWHDPQGNPPPPEVTIPVIEEYGSPEWTSFTWNRMLIEGSHCREIVDNVVDMAHFFYIHYSFPTFFRNVFEGHVAWQYMNGQSRPDVDLGTNYTGEATRNVSEAAYYGPSYMINPMKTIGGGLTIETVLINCHYPVSPTSFVLQWGVMVKKIDGMGEQDAEQFALAFASGVETGFLQDVEIWKNKAKIDNPLLCEEDGPVYQLRRWYEQFYVDVEDVTPEMTNRFEFEIDTAQAREFWQKEVEENLAAGRVVGDVDLEAPIRA
ncbi:Rieske 2Fe-2S domain-containing protein [Actinocorallia populi]|uniref:Rieske 2Fe-2S domain-containing protein n=1 Tax=Actinocorallia populi TaxID=2079200 RepID=UPI000D08FE78|nr:Rieske 2Fe-2S domain-containing protein [Actinocorallia populi]